MKLYHVTTPERAKAILEDGFNENIMPKNGVIHSPGYLHRTFFCRKYHIPKWIRILSREGRWNRIAVVVLEISRKEFKRLLHQSPTYKDWKDYQKPWIWDWGDQLVFDTKECLREGTFGIRLSILESQSLE